MHNHNDKPAAEQDITHLSGRSSSPKTLAIRIGFIAVYEPAAAVGSSADASISTVAVKVSKTSSGSRCTVRTCAIKVAACFLL